MGLRRIVLRDFVIVRELDLDFSDGFTVLTGETGAGKSILIDAVQMVLGARADAGVVPPGAVRAEVSAEFDTPAALAPWLDQAGFEPNPTLLVRRTVDAQGKARAWINASPATATQLRELGEYLLDIHGQHAWQSLTRPDKVRELLDAYAGVDTRALQAAWQAWRQAQGRLESARQAQDTRQLERERLSWQISELDKLAPGEHEWPDLSTQHARLSNAQTLLDTAQQALSSLEDEDRGSLRALTRACDALRRQVHVEPAFGDLVTALDSSLAQAEDAAHSLHQYLRKTDLDPDGLAVLDARLSLWLALARRYHRSPEELPDLLNGWRVQLAQLDASSDLAVLAEQEQKTRRAYLDAARKISTARSKAAPRLSKAITQVVHTLGMQGAQFAAAVTPLPEPGVYGLDAVEFLIAANTGQPPKPVNKVASGGELSRIALAIAVTTSQLGSAPTLIFDEVDSGIGGAVAETVGKMMRKLGADRQVLAVTHLAQVAACASAHCVVHKQHDKLSTVSTVRPVSGEQRITEIARMLGGERLSEATLAHAREMLLFHD
jgi:DNA repair protein RecN (Recombination protein N)